MSNRHIARQCALQALYALEFASAPVNVDATFSAYETIKERGRGKLSAFARDLARGAWDQRDLLDERIAPLLHNWKIDRLPLLEKLMLRMAVCELQNHGDIPLRVTINEYLELARDYSDEDATAYINAVLDRIAREYPDKDFQRPGPNATGQNDE